MLFVISRNVRHVEVTLAEVGTDVFVVVAFRMAEVKIQINILAVTDI